MSTQAKIVPVQGTSLQAAIAVKRYAYANVVFKEGSKPVFVDGELMFEWEGVRHDIAPNFKGTFFLNPFEAESLGLCQVFPMP